MSVSYYAWTSLLMLIVREEILGWILSSEAIRLQAFFEEIMQLNHFRVRNQVERVETANLPIVSYITGRRTQRD